MRSTWEMEKRRSRSVILSDRWTDKKANSISETSVDNGQSPIALRTALLYVEKHIPGPSQFTSKQSAPRTGWGPKEGNSTAFTVQYIWELSITPCWYSSSDVAHVSVHVLRIGFSVVKDTAVDVETRPFIRHMRSCSRPFVFGVRRYYSCCCVYSSSARTAINRSITTIRLRAGRARVPLPT